MQCILVWSLSFRSRQNLILTATLCPFFYRFLRSPLSRFFRYFLRCLFGRFLCCFFRCFFCTFFGGFFSGFFCQFFLRCLLCSFLRGIPDSLFSCFLGSLLSGFYGLLGSLGYEASCRRYDGYCRCCCHGRISFGGIPKEVDHIRRIKYEAQPVKKFMSCTAEVILCAESK